MCIVMSWDCLIIQMPARLLVACRLSLVAHALSVQCLNLLGDSLQFQLESLNLMLGTQIGHFQLQTARDEFRPFPLERGQLFSCLGLILSSSAIQRSNLLSQFLRCFGILSSEVFLLEIV